MCGLLFAFFQTLLSCVGTDCRVMQEKVSITRPTHIAPFGRAVVQW